MLFSFVNDRLPTVQDHVTFFVVLNIVHSNRILFSIFRQSLYSNSIKESPILTIFV